MTKLVNKHVGNLAWPLGMGYFWVDKIAQTTCNLMMGLHFACFFSPHDFEKIRDSDSEGPKVLGMRDVENFMTRLFSTSHWSVLLAVVVLFMCCSCVVHVLFMCCSRNMLQERAHILFPHVPTVSWLAPYHHGRSISIAGYPPREPSPLSWLSSCEVWQMMWVCLKFMAMFLEKMFFFHWNWRCNIFRQTNDLTASGTHTYMIIYNSIYDKWC